MKLEVQVEVYDKFLYSKLSNQTSSIKLIKSAKVCKKLSTKNSIISMVCIHSALCILVLQIEKLKK
ncbi:hypothetical protein BpHYR1_051852 [Brachionus plicatilis]|uniref:Uncharacterized protein n=1 Tax=Brachionus plicatilis TaxID=10195 RepID=A0A3M7SHZ6_BRAPC|nr:hypothetical protein BpHYR1_051852 [Brachionus plicatilis]